MQSFCYVSPLQAVSSMGPYIVSVSSEGVGIPLPPVVGRTMSPKTPASYVTPGPGKRDFADVIKLRILRWEVLLDHPVTPGSSRATAGECR